MKVFIAGPRQVSLLNKEIINRLENIKNNEFTVLVGDANGVDKAVQKYLSDISYKNVLVFATKGVARNNLGKWNIIKVDINDNQKGFDFYAAKDKEMAKNADYGFMIWNGKSKGTLNNIINLTKMNKKVLLYFIPDKKFYTLNSIEELGKFIIKYNDDDTIILFNDLINSQEENSSSNSRKQENLIFDFGSNCTSHNNALPQGARIDGLSCGRATSPGLSQD